MLATLGNQVTLSEDYILGYYPDVRGGVYAASAEAAQTKGSGLCPDSDTLYLYLDINKNPHDV